MIYKVITTFGRGFNVEACLSYLLFGNLSVNFGGSSYSCKSLLGERHAGNMKDGKKHSNAVFVSVSYRY